jgi:citrate synthase
MTQLAIGVASMNHDSKFQAAYEKGMKKSEYWAVMLEDCMSLIAKLPALAARIYRNVYKPDLPVPKVDKSLDLIGTSERRPAV